MVKSRLEQLYKFLEQKPDDSFTLYAIALENIKLNQINEAESLFRSIIENDPDYLAVYYQVGKLMELKNLPEKAIGFYKKGMEIAKQQNDQKTFMELKQLIDNLEEDI